MYSYTCLVGGFNPSENMKVSWDDDISNNYMENNPNFPNHQPDVVVDG